MRRLVVEGPNSIGARARLRRWALLKNAFPQFEKMRVLDLGGTGEAWERSPLRPKSLTVLNLSETPSPVHDGITTVVGDACNAEEVLANAGIRVDFDLVYSNSLIEHLGGHARRLEFAGQVHRLGEHHWVQTPYRYFPLEPHWLFPGMQFMPTTARTVVAQHWPLVHTKPAGKEEACSEALWTELLAVAEMRFYFPDGQLLREKILGVTKSLIAIA